MGFGESAKKWVAEALFFGHVSDAPLPLSLDRFPPNFPRTRVRVVARDTWFHIPERKIVLYCIVLVSIKGSNFPKNPFSLFLGILFVLSLRVTGNVLRRLHSFHPLVDIPQIYLS